MAFPTRVIQLLLLLYCLASVSYTSRRVLQWLLDGASNTGIAIFSLSPSKSAYPQASHQSNLSNHDALSSDLPGFLSSLISTPTETAFHWRSSNNHAGDLGLVSIKGDDDVSLLEETLLSKAFSQSLHPTRIIPFFYKATTIVEQEDVTITTLVTSNRFKVLKQLVERYQGMVIIYVSLLLRKPRSLYRSYVGHHSCPSTYGCTSWWIFQNTSIRNRPSGTARTVQFIALFFHLCRRTSSAIALLSDCRQKL